MEYFKSSLKSVLGTTPAGTQPTGADTVSKNVRASLFISRGYLKLSCYYLTEFLLFKRETEEICQNICFNA